MYRISGSVGQGGRNAYDDVLLVQKMLNKNIHLLAPLTRLPEDGNLDVRTQEAITLFQRRVVRLGSPDGRVDPNGRTWSMLTGDQSHSSTASFVQLPGGDSPGYYIYTATEKVYGTAATIQSIKSLAVNAKAALGVEIGIGDISYANGGKMPPHASHRRGVDVDVRPLRDDGGHSPVTINDDAYSRERTKKLVEIVRDDPNLKSILFNDNAIAGVTFYKGHHNHLHMRFKA